MPAALTPIPALLGYPPEIRQKIYEEVILLETILLDVEAKTLPGLLLVNKQIYHEAILIYQRLSPLHIRTECKDISETSTCGFIHTPTLDKAMAFHVREVILHLDTVSQRILNGNPVISEPLRENPLIQHDEFGFGAWLREAPNVETIHIVLNEYVLAYIMSLHFMSDSDLHPIGRFVRSLMYSWLQAPKLTRVIFHSDVRRQPLLGFIREGLKTTDERVSVPGWDWVVVPALEGRYIKGFSAVGLTRSGDGLGRGCKYNPGCLCKIENNKGKCGCPPKAGYIWLDH